MMIWLMLACSSNGDVDSLLQEELFFDNNHEIISESLRVMIDSDVLQHRDIYKISIIEGIKANPTLEIGLYNHSTETLRLSEDENKWCESSFIEFVEEPPAYIPSNGSEQVQISWLMDMIQDELDTESEAFVRFNVPRLETFFIEFHIQMTEGLDVLFFGDGEYTLVGTENADDFVHEIWNSERSSSVISGHYFLDQFWRIDQIFSEEESVDSEDRTVISSSSDGIIWTQKDMGLEGTPDFCLTTNASFLCFVSNEIWVSFEGENFEQRIFSEDHNQTFYDGVSLDNRGFLLSDEGIFSVLPSGYYELLFSSEVNLQSIAVNTNAELMAVGEQSIFYSMNGKDWQSWNIFTTEGSLHKVRSWEGGWLVGVENNNDYSIWKIESTWVMGESQFDHIADLRLLDVVHNIILATDDSHWLYRSTDGIVWEKIHKMPSHITLHSVAVEKKTVFEGLEQ